jgi:hypothetical protein
VHQKTLDLGRIGARNGPDRGFFARTEVFVGQNLPAAFPKIRFLMGKYYGIFLVLSRTGARNGSNGGFLCQSLSQALSQFLFFYEETLLNECWIRALSLRLTRNYRSRPEGPDELSVPVCLQRWKTAMAVMQQKSASVSACIRPLGRRLV